MITRAARRLPGLRFESRPARLPEVLPRMDVAALVGFAASGPLHTPVAVEDPATFADLFGADAPLAWDRERGELVRGNLGPAVRAFFRNGGTRCWVVRVARTAGAGQGDRDWARANHFPVPGLVRLGPAGQVRPAFLTARSEGSWSDRIGVGAVCAVQPAAIEALEVDGAGAISVRLQAADAVVPGDLLRLTWKDQAVLLAAVAVVQDRVARFVPGAAVWLSPAPPAGGGWTASWFPEREGAAAPLPALLEDVRWNADGTTTARLAGEAPPPGHFVRFVRGAEQVWVLVTGRRAAEGSGSPPLAGTEVSGRWTRLSPAPPAVDPGAPLPTCERLRLELLARAEAGPPRRLGDLGAGPGHPRYLGALPTDRRLFEPDEDLLEPGERALLERVRAVAGDGVDLRGHHAELWQEAANPRFPLAAGADRSDVFLPFGTPVRPEVYLGPRPLPGDAAERDGLARFCAEPFLDPALADQTVRSLLAQADHVRWQQPAPRRLSGIHALLALEEVTLVAVPDVTHRGWSAERVTTPAPLAAPRLAAVQLAEGWRLDWTAVDPEALYLLQVAETADFAAPRAVLLPAGATRFEVPAEPPGRRWFRVRAYLPQPPPSAEAAYFTVGASEAAGSFWSEPVLVVSPPPSFVDCAAPAPGTPALQLAAPPDGTGSYRLAWSAVAGALGYLVQESTELDFLGARTAFAGPDHEVTLYGRAPGHYRYRVRAEGAGGTAGGWSDGVAVAVPSPPRRVLAPAAAHGGAGREALLAVQGALLRLAAARGDLLAVLSLPEHYREAEAVDHVAALRARVPEEEAFSHGALYHPWLLVEGPDAGQGDVRRVPPDGAACGVMSARAAARGAWIAPANQPLGDVLGTTPPIARAHWQRLFDAQVNLVREEPHGFVVLSADTLAVDPDLVPINVRRLLALLRRAALRLGPAFVFEPAGGVFRRTVERQFEALLEGLFRAGAFAGPTASSSYQVAVDRSIQGEQNAELGRFVVEMKVAPSLPMSFLTVRLVQDGTVGQVLEGA